MDGSQESHGNFKTTNAQPINIQNYAFSKSLALDREKHRLE